MSGLRLLLPLLWLLCQAGGDTLAERLASPDAERARAAAAALRRMGPEGEALVWRAFAAAPPAERRARLRWAVESGGSASVAPAIEALDDPDAGVRRAVLRLLARVDAPVAPRAAALVRRAAVEPSAELRAAIAEALATLGGAASAEARLAWLADWPAPERVAVAAGLAAERATRERIAGIVAAEFGGEAPRLPADVLAVLLPVYGRALADADPPAETPRARAPLLLGLRHPAPEVRAGARLALEEQLLRLRSLERTRGADRLLAALAREGPDPLEAHHRRALHALQEGLDPELARGSALELARLARLDPGPAGRLWRFRAAYLEAAVEIAAGRSADAARPSARAEGLLDGLLAERFDLSSEAGAAAQHDLVHQRALLELLGALRLIAEGRGAGDPQVLERARTVHQLELEAQLLAVEAGLGEIDHLDVLFEAGTSPLRLALPRRPTPAWPVERQLRAERELGRALETVAPLEVAGFGRAGDGLGLRADPFEDGPRQALLREIMRARVRAAERDYRELLGRLTERAFRGETIDTRDEERLAILEFSRRQRSREVQEGAREHYASLRSLSHAGLQHARALADEGHTQDARDTARRLLDEIERRQLAQRDPRALDLAARLRIAIGSAWTADGEGLAAQEELERAVERLEALEVQLSERGALLGAAAARDSRAGALVSLAVNANVKLGDPVRALAYVERAAELRQDDFMRVLLACYRARSGRDEEARELLAEVPLAPPHYYNLACTYALLGEVERALEFLGRELAENHPSEGSLRQQRAWAREDPDLAALRDDPRFVELVGEAEEDDR